ncbi:DUF2178 domain-containing protein [Thermococcus sp.]
MDSEVYISLLAFVAGVIFYLLTTREIMKNLGFDADERAFEVAKLSAMRTLELVLLIVVVEIFYSSFISKNEGLFRFSSLLLLVILFGNLAFRAYYSRVM